MSKIEPETKSQVPGVNQTVELGLVIKEEGVKAKLGHTRILVHREKQDCIGRDLPLLARCWDPLLSRLRSRPSAYDSYLVPSGTKFRFAFRQTCLTQDGGLEFELRTVLWCEIGQPELLVEQIHSDPVSRLEEQANSLVWSRVKRLPWEAIFDEGRPFFQALDGVREELRRSAEGMGLSVLEIEVSRDLSGVEREHAQKKEEWRKQWALEEARRKSEMVEAWHKHRTNAVHRFNATVDRLMGILEEITERASSKISGFREMERALEDFRQVKLKIEELVSGTESSSHSVVQGELVLPDESGTTLALAEGDLESRLRMDILDRTQYLQPSLQASLRSQMFGILESISEDGVESSETLAAAVETLRESLKKAARQQVLDRELIDLIRRLTDIQTLKRDLQG